MSEKLVFTKPKYLSDRPTHYCPGCQHGVVQRLVAEMLEDMALGEKTIAVSSIGCSVFLYHFIVTDTVEAPHGRAPAVATGVKRAKPDHFVFTYQGDGDLASIGLSEIMHAANRGERISVVFVNNTVYGMTGGQMAPTTLLGQKTTTCPQGRKLAGEGGPMHMAELIASLPGTAFSARVAVDTSAHVRKAKKTLRQAFEAQTRDMGLGFIEILATCPTNWRMSPSAANKHVAEALIPEFPLGVFKNVAADGEAC